MTLPRKKNRLSANSSESAKGASQFRSEHKPLLHLLCTSFVVIIGCSPTDIPQNDKNLDWTGPALTSNVTQPSQSERPKRAEKAEQDVYEKYVEQLGEDFRRELSQLQAGQARTLRETKLLIEKGEDIVQQAENGIAEWRHSDYFAATAAAAKPASAQITTSRQADD